LQTTEGQSERALFRHHVRRPRLTELLDSFSAQAVVICAPAGYGKTVLAAEWARSGRRVAWCRATEAWADLAVFSVGIADAVCQLLPRAGAGVRRQVEVAGPAESDPELLAELLAADLGGWPEDAFLIVDDYHLVQESRPVEKFVGSLLAHSAVHLLVTTRSRPDWASARQMLYGEIAEIGPAELAMTEEEAARVLRGVPTETASRAVAQAGGWPAVIGLAALSPSIEIPDEAFSDALYRYFAEEVLRRESPEVQRFMLRASVPMGLDSATARELLGIPRAERALTRLVGEGLLEPSNEVYRFHPLLRAFLRQKLESEEPAEATALVDDAVAFAAGRGRLEEAVELALENGNRDRAAELAAQAAPSLLRTGRAETLRRWLEACGAAALKQPPLLLARAALLIRRGELADAATIARGVAARAEGGEDYASRAWYLTAQAHHQLGERNEALECADRARELALTDEDRMNALVLCTLSADALELDDSDYLLELERLAGDDLQARFRWVSAEIWSALRRPTLAGVWQKVAPLVSVVDSCEGPMLRSDVLNGASQLNLLRADYAAAVELAERAVGVCADFRLRLNHVFALLCLANAQIGRHQYRRAEQSLRAVRDSGYLDRPGVRITYGIARLKLALARDEPVHASSSETISAEQTSRRSRALHAALRAMAAAKSGDVQGCRDAAMAARAESQGAEASFYSRYAELIAQPESARDVVAFLEETAGAEMLDSFVTAYRAAPRLLLAAVSDPRSAEIARRATAGAGDRALAREAGLFEERPLARESALTPREREVLELMKDGLSNADIARRLFISPSTTKVHVHHILEKLDSKSRVEAVLKAKARE
jgi:LuxR family transcriptional regulator, maltose regulon positive regulatory protein